jgi:hypothetical protein
MDIKIHGLECMNKQQVKEALEKTFKSSIVDVWLSMFPDNYIFEENYLTKFINYINSLPVYGKHEDKPMNKPTFITKKK